ncbi:putative inorganic phosphate cotransporter [Schistocerca serialis cubense]|uniref:putative inorganic phosphate cotransporter n=1 Tax=Schistocerca serialis cubense TaxID=2023355 RepID=UPI00214ECA7A|nr:putative inorganic phosphate cotransporter [Schistocerca serialis cubense]
MSASASEWAASYRVQHVGIVIGVGCQLQGKQPVRLPAWLPVTLPAKLAGLACLEELAQTYRLGATGCSSDWSPPGWLLARDVLWLLAFCGFAINYSVRVNLNIAIVAMVKGSAPLAREAEDVGYCTQSGAVFQNTSDVSITIDQGSLWNVVTGANSTSFNTSLEIGSTNLQEGLFDWDEKQQGLVLGSFFWLHWSTQIPGGILARRFSPKLVFGLSNLAACLLAVLIPLAASVDYRALIAVRVFQGIVAGMAWPAMHCLIARWVPPNDRSKFVSAYLGGSMGAALTFLVSGLLIGWLGWPAVFYATALAAIVWFFAWWLLIFDHPHKHPRISTCELANLHASLGEDTAVNKPTTPWKHILTSPQVWLIVFTQWGGFWGLFTVLTQAPTYMRNIHGWGIGMVGLLTGLPHVCRTMFSLVVSSVGDCLLKRGLLSRTKLRKSAAVIYLLGQGALLVGVACSGCSGVAAAACITASVAVSGAISTGPLAAMIDLSPSYCGILLALTNMICVTPGFISPIMVGHLTYQAQTPEQWRVVFLVVAALVSFSGLMYVLFSTAQRQPWDPPCGQPYAGAGEGVAAERQPLQEDNAHKGCT